MKNFIRSIITVVIVVSFFNVTTGLRAQGTAFTYQGVLNVSGSPANGNYDLSFQLYDAATTNGSAVGSAVTVTNTPVTNGLFTVPLNFGAVFTGSNYWVQVGARTNGSLGYTNLSPLLPISPTPYAIFAESASNALTAVALSGTLSNANLSGVYTNLVTFSNASNAFSGNGAGLTNLANVWLLTGNAGTTPGAQFLGTTDTNALEFHVNGKRVLRLEPVTGGPNVIGGSPANFILSGVANATISGGLSNQVTGVGGSTGVGAFIGGGGFDGASYGGNQTAGGASVIAGGVGNIISSASLDAVIGGGALNTISTNAPQSTIAGGLGNIIAFAANKSTIGGGSHNQILVGAYQSFIAGGNQNVIGTNSYVSTVGGGYSNVVGNGATFCTIAGGAINSIGPNAVGSTISGGENNVAAGSFSFAAGYKAQATNTGAFVWADSQNVPFASATDNSFNVRAQRGVIFTDGLGHTNSWTPGSGSWNFASDRNLKDHFAAVDSATVLDKVSKLPVTEWSYKGYNQRHIGAMAQDFHALFPLNDNDKVLNEADLHGVELAAIKGLNQKLKAKDAENQALKQEVGDLEARFERLEKAVANMPGNNATADKE